MSYAATLVVTGQLSRRFVKALEEVKAQQWVPDDDDVDHTRHEADIPAVSSVYIIKQTEFSTDEILLLHYAFVVYARITLQSRRDSNTINNEYTFNFYSSTGLFTPVRIRRSNSRCNFHRFPHSV